MVFHQCINIRDIVVNLLEEGTATHCSILAWEIPWTEETGGLEPTGSQSQT